MSKAETETSEAKKPCAAPTLWSRRFRLAAVLATILGTMTSSAYLLSGAEIFAVISDSMSAFPRGGDGDEQKTTVTGRTTLGDINDIAGAVLQENFSNINLYNTEFRLEVIRQTDDAPPANKALRDQVLGITDQLMATLADGTESAKSVGELGRALGNVLEEAPVSSYQLSLREFTLAPGLAYFLPGGTNSFALVGPAEAEGPDAVAVRRNGRTVVMKVGSVRIFTQNGDSCRLLLHELAKDRTAATFSYTCDRA